MTTNRAIFTAVLGSMALLACGSQQPLPSPAHLKDVPATTGTVPPPLPFSAVLPPPKPAAKVETYSVTVYRVPVQSLLFALARDAKVNIDIHPGISGEVTLNALDQTLPQLLNRISKQIDMRYELDGTNLVVMPDEPFVRNYKVDYVNVARDSTSTVSISTQIGTGSESGAGSNNSTTTVANVSNNRFWATLVQNVRDLLREMDRVAIESPDRPASGTAAPSATAASSPATPAAPATAAAGAPAGAAAAAGAAPAAAPAAPTAGATAAAAPATGSAAAAGSGAGTTLATQAGFRSAASVTANPETGLLSVRATARQHEKVQEFLDMVLSSARRQVLIEATVVEVQLNDQYQQGINWSAVRTGTNAIALAQGQNSVSSVPSRVEMGITPSIFGINFSNRATLSATIRLLESFGKVKVLSSPKVSVLNNQTALLKVVDNRVYFTISAEIEPATPTTPERRTYTSTVHTVPVGLVMSVTPQIADTEEVTLNVRPSISRIVGFVNDPSPVLAAAGVVSGVPEIQTREMESVLKVASGQIAVMGGLMQDGVSNVKDTIPGASRLGGLGDLLGYRNEATTKSELVIFMRPVVVKNASLEGDYRGYRYLLPDDTSFAEPYSSLPRPSVLDGVMAR